MLIQDGRTWWLVTQFHNPNEGSYYPRDVTRAIGPFDTRIVDLSTNTFINNPSLATFLRINPSLSQIWVSPKLND